MICPSFAISLSLSLKRTQGKPGADCARRPMCESSERKHTGFRLQVQPGHPGFPRATVLRLIRALPGERRFLPPSPAGYARQLDATVAAPGPHDFAVRCERSRPVNGSPDAAASIATRANVP